MIILKIIDQTMKPILFAVITAGILCIASCGRDPDENPASGKISITFRHLVNGEDLRVDTAIYVNAAGNHYLVSEIQYFISDITLHRSDGGKVRIDREKSIHYIDTDIPESWLWHVADSIPEGSYDSVTFTFGVPAAVNITGLFPNPPESNMFWPDVLGGGYHAMKLNGKWLDSLQMLSPFHLHLGTGQLYDSLGNITSFVPNDFPVTLAQSGFVMEGDALFQIMLTMNIESWFETPHDYDFNYWGGGIMQNQAAMQVVKENGHDVFTAELEIVNE